jgi:hypothetical protein
MREKYKIIILIINKKKDDGDNRETIVSSVIKWTNKKSMLHFFSEPSDV